LNRFVQLGADIATLWSRYRVSYFRGMGNTLLLALTATVIGCVIGFICGILQTIPHAPTDNPAKRFFLALIRGIIRIYVEVFRGTPMVLQAVFVYYGLPYFSGNAIQFHSVWLAAILVVSVNTGAYMAETVRGGILSIDPGQTEGAKAIGMNHWQTMFYVILPQALRNILPQIGNNYIINVKDTSVMFIISFTEFFAVHRAAVGATYLYFPSAVIEMLGYLCMTLTASLLLRLWEKKLDGDDSYSLASVDSLAPTAGMLNHPGKGSNFDEQSREFREAAKNRNFSTRGDR
jgi:putative lysine transport system permease protein